jgi:hypothetical protein
MSRTIKKKVIRDDLLFSDNFDQETLDKIEGELSDEDAPDPRQRGEFSDEIDRGYDTDEIDYGRAASTQGEQNLLSTPKHDAKAPPGSQTDAAPPPPTALAQRIARKKVLLLGILIFTAIIAAGSGYILSGHSPEPPPKPAIVRFPILIPAYQQEMDFLLFSEVGEKYILDIALEVNFEGQSAHERFKQKRTVYKDNTFIFLQSQQTSDKSYRNWEKIIQEDLPKALQASFPEIRIGSVELKRFNRL